MTIKINPENLTEQGKENLRKWGKKRNVAEQAEEKISETFTQEPEQEITESIDTLAEVLEFRRGFVDGVEKEYDVTQKKLKEIVKIGEKLVESKDFHFEDSGYGEMGVLKLGGKIMKFLNIAHPQDFNNQLTHKIKDESLKKNYDYKNGKIWNCRCENTQDLVLNKAMPGGRAEDAGIVELLDKVKDSTGLGQLSNAKMEEIIYDILKNYCNQNGVIFNSDNDYILLYMYLMGPKGGYGRQWLSDLQNSSRSYFKCDDIYRCFDSYAFDSYIYDSNYASFFLGLLVDDLGEKKENHSIELPAGLPDYAYEVDKNFKNETGNYRNPEMIKKIDEAVLKMREDGILKTESKDGGVYTTINFPNEKPIHFLEPDLIKHSDEGCKSSYNYLFGGKNVHKNKVKLLGMGGDVDEWKNEKLKQYVKQSRLSLPKESKIKGFMQNLADFVNSEYKLNISSEEEQIDLFCRAMNSIGNFWLADYQNFSRSYFRCNDSSRGFNFTGYDDNSASFFLTDYLL